ncbi:MAG: cob(I)yrinic acid a,c-diamide adenosyltransferase [Oscillospiraceae bacterium]
MEGDLNVSCIHVYCGDGKGKTTSALGLGLRMCGSGGRVLLAQFLKSSSSSELAALSRIDGFDVLPRPGKPSNSPFR